MAECNKHTKNNIDEYLSEEEEDLFSLNRRQPIKGDIEKLSACNAEEHTVDGGRKDVDAPITNKSDNVNNSPLSSLLSPDGCNAPPSTSFLPVLPKLEIDLSGKSSLLPHLNPPPINATVAFLVKTGKINRRSAASKRSEGKVTDLDRCAELKFNLSTNQTKIGTPKGDHAEKDSSTLGSAGAKTEKLADKYLGDETSLCQKEELPNNSSPESLEEYNPSQTENTSWTVDKQVSCIRFQITNVTPQKKSVQDFAINSTDVNSDIEKELDSDSQPVQTVNAEHPSTEESDQEQSVPPLNAQTGLHETGCSENVPGLHAAATTAADDEEKESATTYGSKDVTGSYKSTDETASGGVCANAAEVVEATIASPSKQSSQTFTAVQTSQQAGQSASEISALPAGNRHGFSPWESPEDRQQILGILLRPHVNVVNGRRRNSSTCSYTTGAVNLADGLVDENDQRDLPWHVHHLVLSRGHRIMSASNFQFRRDNDSNSQAERRQLCSWQQMLQRLHLNFPRRSTLTSHDLLRIHCETALMSGYGNDLVRPSTRICRHCHCRPVNSVAYPCHCRTLCLVCVEVFVQYMGLCPSCHRLIECYLQAG